MTRDETGFNLSLLDSQGRSGGEPDARFREASEGQVDTFREIRRPVSVSSTAS
jgi:hypothetical protein